MRDPLTEMERHQTNAAYLFTLAGAFFGFATAHTASAFYVVCYLPGCVVGMFGWGQLFKARRTALHKEGEGNG